MDVSKIFVMAAVFMTASCASSGATGTHCPVVDVRYAGKQVEAGGRVAVFNVINRGVSPIEFPLERGAKNIIHSRYVSTEQRPSNGGSWKPYNLILDEVMAPVGTIVISPGRVVEFGSDVNGLLLNDNDPEMEYSVVVKDVAGCVYRSSPFNP